MNATHHYTLTISCPDRAGIIAAVSGFIAQQGGFIVEASYHTEQDAQRFFMRQSHAGEFGIHQFRQSCTLLVRQHYISSYPDLRSPIQFETSDLSCAIISRYIKNATLH